MVDFSINCIPIVDRYERSGEKNKELAAVIKPMPPTNKVNRNPIISPKNPPTKPPIAKAPIMRKRVTPETLPNKLE
jgi:hypothetical protein